MVLKNATHRSQQVIKNIRLADGCPVWPGAATNKGFPSECHEAEGPDLYNAAGMFINKYYAYDRTVELDTSHLPTWLYLASLICKLSKDWELSYKIRANEEPIACLARYTGDATWILTPENHSEIKYLWRQLDLLGKTND